MTYNKDIIKTLKERIERLKISSVNQFANELKFLLQDISKNEILRSIILLAIDKYPLANQELTKIVQNLHYQFYNQNFQDLKHQAAWCYQLTQRLTLDGFNLNQRDELTNGTFKETQPIVINELIEPIVNYLIDQLEESNSILYLLEKYNRKVEWFTGKNLKKKYDELNANYEDYFEEDLRLFLFEQGIDYPFSTPKSSSGRSDIVGGIDTKDPLIVEVKIFDRSKDYGKNRIKSGFTQILRYTEDYNKNQGFLVIFKVDEAELNFELEQPNYFPPLININNKTYYIVTVNISENISASKKGKSEIISITKEDLIS